MSLPIDVLNKWREDVNKMCYVGLHNSSNPEIEELLTADHLLERAYAHDPLVIAWLDAHGYAIEELEAEVERLERALARRRVGAKIIDVLRMREEIAEKERHLTPLLELELILEGAQRGERGALDKMKEKGFETIDALETEVNRLRKIVLDPQKIIPLILKDHTEVNIVSLARFVQAEGAIGYRHHKERRMWIPYVTMGMSIEEPMRHTAGLLSVSLVHIYDKREVWQWVIDWAKAFSTLETIEPYLMADKWEEARYVLNIGKIIPNIEYRPMYSAIIKGRIRPVFLYPEYVDFPVKYAVVVHKGDLLPRPIQRLIAFKYTPEGMPIRWHEGMIRDP